MNKKQIMRIKMVHEYDYDADTSYLGTYTDKISEWVICRHCGEYVYNAEKDDRRKEEIEEAIDNLEDSENQERDKLKKELDELSPHNCPIDRREYNYFAPYAMEEKEGSKDYQEYGKQDFKRMEKLNNGDWIFIGIIAIAEIRSESGIIQKIHSGGLWGIESDSDKEFIAEIEKEELTALAKELESIGFSKRQIKIAMEKMERKDN